MNEAEFAVLISDQFQGRGLGTELVKRLIEIARAEGIARVTADILGENRQMIEICGQLGFNLDTPLAERCGRNWKSARQPDRTGARELLLQLLTYATTLSTEAPVTLAMGFIFPLPAVTAVLISASL